MNLNCLLDPNITGEIGKDDKINELLMCSQISFTAYSWWTKYSQELPLSLRNLMGELSRGGRMGIRKLDDSDVDSRSQQIKDAATKWLDDEHLMWIVDIAQETILFGNKKICVITYDKRSHKFLLNRTLYKKPCHTPKIFPTSKKQSVVDLLRSDFMDCIN